MSLQLKTKPRYSLSKWGYFLWFSREIYQLKWSTSDADKKHNARFHIFWSCATIRIPQESSWSPEYDALMRDKIRARARARCSREVENLITLRRNIGHYYRVLTITTGSSVIYTLSTTSVQIFSGNGEFFFFKIPWRLGPQLIMNKICINIFKDYWPPNLVLSF